MKTLLPVKLFALAVSCLIVISALSNIPAPLARASHVASAHMEKMAYVIVTGKRMSSREKVEYDSQVMARTSTSFGNTAAR